METRKLGDICEIVSGGTPLRSKPEFWNNGTIPWIKISNIKGKFVAEADESITQAGLDGSSAKMLTKGTLLYSIFATLGETGILSIDACTNQAIAGLTIKNPKQISTDYLYYYLKSKKSYVNNIGRGVAQNNINLSILRNFEIPIPELITQTKIVDILTKTENIISAREKQLQALDNLIKARFVEMFGNPIYNPNNLPIKTLNDLGTWNSGGTPSRANPDYFKGNINWYSAGELNSLFLQGSIEQITYEAINMSSAKLFKAGSMLVGMYDTAAFKMGILKEESSSNQACACIEPYSNVDIIWLYYELQLMKDHFLSLRRGVRQKNLNLGMIKGFEIPVPNYPCQRDFSSFVAQVDKSKVIVQKALDEAQLLFDSLMQQYFG